MATDAETGNVLEYIYLAQETPVTLDDVTGAADLSADTVRQALDELEERMLIDVGGDGYTDISITGKGVDLIEAEDDFDATFGSPLDLNRIAREWGSR